MAILVRSLPRLDTNIRLCEQYGTDARSGDLYHMFVSTAFSLRGSIERETAQTGVLQQKSRHRQGESLRRHEAMACTCGLSVIVGLGLYSYYVRELLASLALFTAVFFFLGLVALTVFLLWCASVQVAIWTPPASRNMIAFSRRLISAYAKT